MPAPPAQHIGHPLEAEAVEEGAGVVLHIHRIVEALVEPSDPFIHRSAHEANVGAGEDVLHGAVPRREDLANGGGFLRGDMAVFTGIVEDGADRADPIDARIAKKFADAPERAGGQQVVAVQVGPDFARHALQPFVDGVRLAAVALDFEDGNFGPVAFEDLLRLVGGARVHHDQLEIGIALIHDGVEGRLDVAALVVAGDDDANARPFHRRKG